MPKVETMFMYEQTDSAFGVRTRNPHIEAGMEQELEPGHDTNRVCEALRETMIIINRYLASIGGRFDTGATLEFAAAGGVVEVLAALHRWLAAEEGDAELEESMEALLGEALERSQLQ